MGDIVAAKTDAINAGGSLRARRDGQARRRAPLRARLVLFPLRQGRYGGAAGRERAFRAGLRLCSFERWRRKPRSTAVADRDFEPVMLRNGTAFGASPRMRLDLVLGNLMAYGYATGVIRVLSDGTPWRPLVDIEDISRAGLAAVEAPVGSLPHTVFNIGRRDCNYTVREIAEVAARHLPGCRIEITGEAGNDPRSYRVDFSLCAQGAEGLRPAMDAGDGRRRRPTPLAALPRAADRAPARGELHPPAADPDAAPEREDRRGFPVDARVQGPHLDLLRKGCDLPHHVDDSIARPSDAELICLIVIFLHTQKAKQEMDRVCRDAAQPRRVPGGRSRAQIRHPKPAKWRN